MFLRRQPHSGQPRVRSPFNEYPQEGHRISRGCSLRAGWSIEYPITLASTNPNTTHAGMLHQESTCPRPVSILPD